LQTDDTGIVLLGCENFSGWIVIRRFSRTRERRTPMNWMWSPRVEPSLTPCDLRMRATNWRSSLSLHTQEN